MEIKIMKLVDLHEDPKNARKHNKKNIDLICKSLKEFDQYKNIVVQKSTGKIIAGNGTYQAAKVLGWDEIECNVVDIPDDKATAMAVVDNRSTDLSSWDNDVLGSVLDGLSSDDLEVTGFDDKDIEKLLKAGSDDDKKSAISDVEEWNISDVDMNPAWVVIRTTTDYVEELLELIESKSDLYRQLEFSCEGNDKKEGVAQAKNIIDKLDNISSKKGEEQEGGIVNDDDEDDNDNDE